MRSKFRGVGVALITPFNKDLSIDFDALEKIINNCIEGGANYLVTNGTTAEASTLSITEKNDLLNFVTKVNNKRLPIMYGIGTNSTQQALDIINQTNFENIDAILTVSPYYNKPSQAGIERHYNIIANHSPKPVLLYNVPGRTGSNISAATTTALSKHPNIFGIKEASGDLNQCFEIMRDKTDDFMLISGDDLLTTPMISIGCEGAISVLANAYPKEFCAMIKNALNGDFTKATKTLLEFTKINDLLYAESNPVGIKQVLAEMGVCKNYVREPLLEASPELQSKIKQALSTLSL